MNLFQLVIYKSSSFAFNILAKKQEAGSPKSEDRSRKTEVI